MFRQPGLISILGFAIFFSLLFSCNFTGPVREDKTAKNFSFPEPSAGWVKRANQEGAQRIYEYGKTGSVLSVSSTCERYEMVPIDRMARSALSPLGFYQEKETKTFQMDGREAFEIFVSGKVDGVPVEVDYVVLRKDECIFDFSLHASPAIRPQARVDFHEMLKGFKF